MSYFCFMACSRELETGSYSSQPKVIYPSYSAFMESEDYKIFEYNRASPGYRKQNPDFPHEPTKAVGQVYVFNHMRDNHCVTIYPFTALSERTEEEKFIAEQFTLPYLYRISEFPPDLLCKYLQPNDRLEFLHIFLGHNSPLYTPITNRLDLQDFVDGLLLEREIARIISTPPDNNLTHVLPPRTLQMHFEIRPVDFSEIICTIHLNNADVCWNRKQLLKQGLL